jgi:hypothetical protein
MTTTTPLSTVLAKALEKTNVHKQTIGTAEKQTISIQGNVESHKDYKKLLEKKHKQASLINDYEKTVTLR